MSVELKSCLKKPGSIPNPNPITFNEKLQLVTSTNEIVQVSLPTENTKKKPTSDEPSEEEEDMVMDLSKYLGKSIYDSSSEEETEEKLEETKQQTKEKKTKGKKEKKVKEKESGAVKQSRKGRKKLSISERLKLKRKSKSSMKGVTIHYNPKELIKQNKESKENTNNSVDVSQIASDKLLMDGYCSIKSLEPGNIMKKCKFSFMGNGVLDICQVSAAEGIAEFLYYISYIPLYPSSEETVEEISKTTLEHQNIWIPMECFLSLPSDEYDASSPGTPPNQITVIFQFAHSSEKNKFMKILKYFFPEGEWKPKAKQNRLAGLRQSSAKNLSKVFKSKGDKAKLPFPGIAFHDDSQIPSTKSSLTIPKVNSSETPKSAPTITSANSEKIRRERKTRGSKGSIDDSGEFRRKRKKKKEAAEKSEKDNCKNKQIADSDDKDSSEKELKEDKITIDVKDTSEDAKIEKKVKKEPKERKERKKEKFDSDVRKKKPIDKETANDIKEGEKMTKSEATDSDKGQKSKKRKKTSNQEK